MTVHLTTWPDLNAFAKEPQRFPVNCTYDFECEQRMRDTTAQQCCARERHPPSMKGRMDHGSMGYL